MCLSLTIKKRLAFARRYFGDPEGIRTPGLLIRSQTLYPAELLSHMHLVLAYIIISTKSVQELFYSSFNS